MTADFQRIIHRRWFSHPFEHPFPNFITLPKLVETTCNRKPSLRFQKVCDNDHCDHTRTPKKTQTNIIAGRTVELIFAQSYGLSSLEHWMRHLNDFSKFFPFFLREVFGCWEMGFAHENSKIQFWSPSKHHKKRPPEIVSKQQVD